MIRVVGVGPGAARLMTPEAEDALRAAGEVWTSARLVPMLCEKGLRAEVLSVPEMQRRLAAAPADADIAVAAVGDVGFYSIASTLKKACGEDRPFALVPGVGSLAYLCARAGVGYEDAFLLSLHGRGGSILAAVSYHRLVFCLTGGENSARALIETLCAHGLGDARVWVGERLSYPDERVSHGAAETLRGRDFDALASLLVENSRCAARQGRLPDGAFVRGDAPMTKEIVRTVSVDWLDIAPGDVVYDVGAGTGSVSVALGRRAWQGLVYAVEKEPAALALLRENVRRFGTHNVLPVAGTAPDALADLPAPDAAFIGGSGGGLAAIVRLLLAKNPRVRIVVNALTLETLGSAGTLFDSLGLHWEAVCVNAAVSRPLGRYRMMQAQNPVYILRAGGKDAPHEG